MRASNTTVLAYFLTAFFVFSETAANVTNGVCFATAEATAEEGQGVDIGRCQERFRGSPEDEGQKEKCQGKQTAFTDAHF